MYVEFGGIWFNLSRQGTLNRLSPLKLLLRVLYSLFRKA
jgi:hypothetical protein